MNVLKMRFIPILMVCVLALTMIAPAFADNETTITGTYVAAEIAVNVPTTGQAFINPYALPVKLSSFDEGSDGDLVNVSSSSIMNQQIVTVPMAIENYSEVDLSVSAKVTGTIPDATLNNTLVGTSTGSGVKFVTSAPKAADTSKSVFAYLQMKVVDDLTKASTNGDLLDAFANWTDTNYDKDKDQVVGTSTATKSAMAVLAKGEASGGDAGELVATAGSIAIFRLTGKVTTEPNGGWQNTDTFQVKIAFTFKPETEDAKATISNISETATLTSTASSITLNVGLVNTDAKAHGQATFTTATAGDINDFETIEYNGDVYGYVVKLKDNYSGGNKVVGLIATIEGTNGKTYTSDPFYVTIDIT